MRVVKKEFSAILNADTLNWMLVARLIVIDPTIKDITKRKKNK
jgi:hypothetical protein